jgi:hypothetical protein
LLRIDRERASFIKKYFHVRPNRSLYHAMLNTGNGDETVVLAIMGFLEQSRSKPQP